jgi:hypothetical protein
MLTPVVICKETLNGFRQAPVLKAISPLLKLSGDILANDRYFTQYEYQTKGKNKTHQRG